MPDDTVVKPETQKETKPLIEVEVERKISVDALPDEVEEKPDLVKEAETARVELERQKAEFQKLSNEKETLEKRLKDNQEYISRTRNLEKEPAAVPQRPVKTFAEYMKELEDTFENDPKAAIRKLATDVAYDRDLERQEYDKRLQDAEERAYRRALAVDPERGKLVQAVGKLDEERPDLKNLTFEQKMEFVQLRQQHTTETNEYLRERTDKEREMLGDGPGNGSVSSPRSKLPSWVNDPEVLKEASRSGFASKKEILDWTDPRKARELARKTRLTTAVV